MVEGEGDGEEPEGGEEAAAEAPTSEADVGRARELFSQGVELAAAERWAHAIEAFERALELRAAPAIRYNLAAALVESGRYRDAHRELLALEADPETPENLGVLGQTLRERLRTEAAHLRIERAPAIGDAEVVLDTLPVPEELLSTSIPVRAGEHRIVATRGTEMLAAVTVMAPVGEATRALLTPASTAEGMETETPQGASIIEEPLFWVGVGGGVLVVAAVVVAAIVLSSSSGGTDSVPGNLEPAIITWP